MTENDPQNETKGTKIKAKKAKSTKPKTISERWKQTALANKIMAILGVLSLIVGAIYTCSTVRGLYLSEHHYVQEHRPIVIISRPPIYLQPFICETERGLTTGNMEVFAKNIGNETATHVVLLPLVEKIIPEKRTGNPFWDDAPQGDCEMVPNSGLLEFSLNPSEERSLHIRQGRGPVPPLKEGDAVQLFGVACVYYSDSQGGNHAACADYQFSAPSDNPIDSVWGTPTFFCDGKPKFGTFRRTLHGGCTKE